MRNKKFLASLVVLGLMVSFWACHRNTRGDDSPQREGMLTVQDVRQLFDKQMIGTKSKAFDGKGCYMVHPGNFTPLWKKAVITTNSVIDGADIPIDPEFEFIARFPIFGASGDTTYKVVPVKQKLIMRRPNSSRGSTEPDALFIMTLIPNPEYQKRVKNYYETVRYGELTGYSGHIIYHTLDGRFVAIDKFSNGQQLSNNYVPVLTRENYDSVVTMVNQQLEGVTFISTYSVGYNGCRWGRCERLYNMPYTD